ncbi:LOW QUALITY PROTEIN: uncharacterized protein EMH_0047790 [Eimeria mitis]|uniref:Uncharacterized protein n=1 Tax=Eimeria mitis TaxID=44415 RepID=U6KGR9_9EIME|nr:LOW QUALITY PROTEIN: uncharacterized protein EMH_0047790 [Eimeria mitis]CDJ35971.1 hypothetical protein EMH_0047790 [Eimeria mitis]
MLATEDSDEPFSVCDPPGDDDEERQSQGAYPPERQLPFKKRYLSRVGETGNGGDDPQQQEQQEHRDEDAAPLFGVSRAQGYSEAEQVETKTLHLFSAYLELRGVMNIPPNQETAERDTPAATRNTPLQVRLLQRQLRLMKRQLQRERLHHQRQLLRLRRKHAHRERSRHQLQQRLYMEMMRQHQLWQQLWKQPLLQQQQQPRFGVLQQLLQEHQLLHQSSLQQEMQQHLVGQQEQLHAVQRELQQILFQPQYYRQLTRPPVQYAAPPGDREQQQREESTGTQAKRGMHRHVSQAADLSWEQQLVDEWIDPESTTSGTPELGISQQALQFSAPATSSYISTSEVSSMGGITGSLQSFKGPAASGLNVGGRAGGAVGAAASRRVMNVAPRSCLVDLERAVATQQGRRDLVTMLLKANHLLSRQVLYFTDLRHLARIAEGMIEHGMIHQSQDLSEQRPWFAVERLGMRFLLMDSVVSALIVIGQEVNAASWKRFTDTIGHRGPLPPPRRRVTQWRNTFTSILAKELSRGIQTLKTGRRLAPQHLLKIHRMLFCSALSPTRFKRKDFDPFRAICTDER